LPAVETSGAIWVGASGRLIEPGEKAPFAEVQSLGSGAVAGIHLPRAQYEGYYQGFSNSALWPVLHSRCDLMRASKADYASYRAINRYMARSLLRFASDEVMFWVHDYHFLPLAAELRNLGVRDPIGFFLHTPFPEPAVFAKLPHHRELVEAMLAYDLIGFQTVDDTQRFASYLEQEFGLPCADGTVISGTRVTRLHAFPIGIDAERFARRAMLAAAGPEVTRLRSSLQGAMLAIGVDRIDYSKGLSNRLRAFDLLLTEKPELRQTVSLLQIAVPSRQQIDCYSRLHIEIAGLVGEINGRHSEVDWVPIRYLTRGYPQSKLAGFYRSARVGLVTPHRDGMNLVAKEYVAAQNPHDPGVLVLSRYAGAARQLDAALLVDPDDVGGLAQTLGSAFAMPLEERRDRWQTMMAELCRSSLDAWFGSFVHALRSVAAPLVDEEDVNLIPPLPWTAEHNVLQVS
jgi:trehalose 6-phosphate synthase